MWKLPFVEPERARVIVPPAVDQTRWMFNVQHLVIEDVLDKPLRNIGGIQRLADGDAVVNVVVMTENALRSAL